MLKLCVIHGPNLNLLGARIFFATPLNPTAVLGATLGVAAWP